MSGTVSSAETDERKPEADKTRRVLRIPARYLFALLGFLGFVLVCALRTSMSIVMVSMVTAASWGQTLGSDECGTTGNGTSFAVAKEKERDGEFSWDERTQGIIYGSFFCGFCILPLPAGRLADRFGGKWLFGGAVFIFSVCALLSPTAARLGMGWFVSVRFLSGLAEGAMFPAMRSMINLVALPPEKGRMDTFVYAGAQCGALLGMPIAGLLCDWGFDGGWSMVFYCFGFAGIIWSISWAFFVYGSRPCPELCKHYRTERAQTFPWKNAMTSLPVWVIIISHFSNEWVYYTLLSQMPIYMKIMLNFDIKQNSLFSALPYLGRWIFGVGASVIADYFRNSGKASTTTVIKVANFIGMALPGIILLGITFIGCDKLWTVITLTLAITVGGVMYAGFFCNHMDIAPKFSGTLLALTTSIASTSGIISPYVAGALINNQHTLHQWNIVFYIAAAFSFFAAISFCACASGEVQPWHNFSCEKVNETQRLNKHPYLADSELMKSSAKLISVTARQEP